MTRPIYLDHAATMAPLAGVFEAMTPWLTERFGDPGSGGHAFGWEAERGLETARGRVADLIGANPAEIVFTSGGVEALALAVRGVAEVLGGRRRHLVLGASERRALEVQVDWLAARGFEKTVIDLQADGRVDATAFIDALRPDETLLACLQLASAELGVRQDLPEITKACAEREILLLVDGTVGLGSVPVDVAALEIPLLAMSAHRLGGPKGAGALYARRRKPRVRLAAQFAGSAREKGLRDGVPDVAALVGFGVAAEWWRERGPDERQRLARLVARLQNHLGAAAPEVFGVGTDRLPHVLVLGFEGVEGESLLTALPGIAFSTGSACVTGGTGPSHVMQALPRGAELGTRLVRFSVGPTTTNSEIDDAGPRIADAVIRLRAATP